MLAAELAATPLTLQEELEADATFSAESISDISSRFAMRSVGATHRRNPNCASWVIGRTFFIRR
jgi:hypothetical protein